MFRQGFSCPGVLWYPYAPHPLIAVDRTEKFWLYKDSASAAELTTDELVLRIDKASGAVSFLSKIGRASCRERV